VQPVAHRALDGRAVEEREEHVRLFEVLVDEDREEVGRGEVERPPVVGYVGGVEALALPLCGRQLEVRPLWGVARTGCACQNSFLRASGTPCTVISQNGVSWPRGPTNVCFTPSAPIIAWCETLSSWKRGAAGSRWTCSSHCVRPGKCATFSAGSIVLLTSGRREEAGTGTGMGMGVMREDEEGGSGAREPGSEFSDELEVFICKPSQRSGEVQLGVTTNLLQHLLHLLQAPLQIVHICLGGVPSLHHTLVAQSLLSAAAAIRA
jgi:hypothetical protein